MCVCMTVCMCVVCLRVTVIVRTLGVVLVVLVVIDEDCVSLVVFYCQLCACLLCELCCVVVQLKSAP